jgi:hypothetical protein
VASARLSGVLKPRIPALAGAVTSLAVAVCLFTRWGINGTLSRDEAVYAYGGQQLARGVPPYASIFDPKTPLATMISGIAAAIAHAIGRNDVYMIRVAFFVCACLTVLAIYLLAMRLWSSVIAGLVGAVVFAAFTGFAEDALSGPDAKTPGILAASLSMWFAARRQWLWAGIAGGLAFLTWQPLLIYAVAAVVAAAVMTEARQRSRAVGRAIAGGLAPVVGAVIYFAAVGALGTAVEDSFVFTVIGINHGRDTLGRRIRRIFSVIHTYYGFSGALLVVGAIALVFLIALHLVRNRAEFRQALRAPLVCVVALTFLVQVGFAAADFQGYPDVYPLLPYGALGLAGLAALLIRAVPNIAARRVAALVAVVPVVLLAAFSWVWFTNDPANNDGYIAEQSAGCVANRVLGRNGRLYALGDPMQLVVTHRTNPDRYIYLQSGVDVWKISHTPGGFAGWTAQVQAAHPSMLVVGGWKTRRRYEMGAWLQSHGYQRAYLGRWFVFLAPGLSASLRARGIRVTRKPTRFVHQTDGKRLRPIGC